VPKNENSVGHQCPIGCNTFWHPLLPHFQCFATDILNEYAEKLEEKYILRPHVAENTLKAIENSPDVVYVSKYFYWNLITVDPDDNKFVDCAVAANADFIVTDDRHFNVLKDIPFPSVRVVSADDFVEMLTGVRPAKS